MKKRADFDADAKRKSFSLWPDFFANIVSEIDFEYLKKIGIKACMIDLDGTVVEKNQFLVSPATIERLKKAPLEIYIATNRPKSRSLKNLKDDLSAKGVIHPEGLYAKPSKRYYQNAAKLTGHKPNELVMVGDRFIQDILGANRAGVYSLLVTKLGKPKDTVDKLTTNLQARFAKKILHGYQSVK